MSNLSLAILAYKGIDELISLVTHYIKKRRSSREERENENLDFVLLNLSGNKLSPEAIKKIKTWGECGVISKDIPFIELSDPETYMDNISEFCSNIIEELIKKDHIINNLLLGKYILIPPGLPSLSLAFMSIFHGITGTIPRMSFFYKEDGTFNVIKPFDFHSLRNESRGRLRLENRDKDYVLINLAGRCLSEEAIEEVKTWFENPIIELDIPNLDLNNPDTYMDNVLLFCNSKIDELIAQENLKDNLVLGKFILVPPALSSVDVSLISILHGICGQYPLMSFFYRKNNLFYLTRPVDFQDLCNKFRDEISKI